MSTTAYPIAEYGLIGNCETGALINPHGGIDWLCLPAFDAPSFFGALLDLEKGGTFSIRPQDDCRIERRYLGETAILETRFIGESWTVRLTDFFVTARKPSARFYDFTSLQATRKLVRIVEMERGGPVFMRAQLSARPDYGRGRPDWRPVQGGAECAETAVFSNLALAQSSGDLELSFGLETSQPVFFVLDHAESRHPPDLPEVRKWLEITRAFWREWNLFNYYRGPRREQVRRSAVTLKLLTYAPTGAMVAAPTTSLPEKIGGENNWDYRFTWLRDTTLLINTLFSLGYSGEAKAFYEFLASAHRERCRRGDHRLPVLLPIREGTPVEEETLDHLAGYSGSVPVRRGNRAVDQFQFDNQGNFLQSLYYWKHVGGKIDETKRDMARNALEFLRRHWDEPDNGIWEPLERRHHTYSKISACMAFERGCELGLVSRDEADERCRKIREQVLVRGVRNRNGRRYLADHYGTEAVDATALLAFPVGFLSEELARGTRLEVESQLGDGPWIYRTKDFREHGEGAFVLCGFWRIGHLVREGHMERAEALLEETLAAAGPLGLFAEEIDPASGEFLGNFPQAFSHFGLIAAILNLEQAKAKPKCGRLPDHEKFKAGVGRSIGVRAVIAGFFRVPRTLQLLFSRRSKWPGREGVTGGSRKPEPGKPPIGGRKPESLRLTKATKRQADGGKRSGKGPV